MSLPFNGAISSYYENEAPKDVRKIVKHSGNDPILGGDYPYSERLDKHEYMDQLHALKIELCKMQAWATETGARVLTVFEGRDAAGKGGSIKRVIENLNPRAARIVALTKPSDRESTQWYFQRYIEMLPAGGEITLFDRSWYNRGVVEHVFGFCTTNEREAFFRQVPQFEQMLIDEGIHLVKIWLNVGRAEQLRRFLDREKDPLKQWKLSKIDVAGLKKWDAYTEAISETFDRTDHHIAPWTVIRSDDKRRARLAVIRRILLHLDYPGKDHALVGAPDPNVCGGVDLWNA